VIDYKIAVYLVVRKQKGGTMRAGRSRMMGMLVFSMTVLLKVIFPHTVFAQSQEKIASFVMASNVTPTIELSYDRPNHIIKFKKLSQEAPAKIVLGIEYGKKHEQMTSNTPIEVTTATGDISIMQQLAFINFLMKAGEQLNPTAPTEGNNIEVYIAAYSVSGENETGKIVVYGKQVSNIATVLFDRQ
jgi:hypothetical protein